MVRLSAGWRHTIRRFRGLLLTGSALALGTAMWTDEADAQFLGQDFTSGNAQGATAGATNATAVGKTATAAGNLSTAIGNTALASANSTTAIGASSTASGLGSMAIGNLSLATQLGSLAVGTFSEAFGSSATAVGYDSLSGQDGSTALGAGTIANFLNSTAIGLNSATTRNSQMMFGITGNTYTVPGITSAASLAALSGSGQFVTSDASGNLALTNSTTGRVGFGTFTPDANSRMDIRSSTLINGLLAARSDAGPHFLRVENTGGVFRAGVQGNGDAQFGALSAGKGLNLVAGGTTKLLMNSTGQITFGNAPPAITDKALIHQSGAYLTLGGVWTSVSSRAAKQDIEPITSEEARDTVRALQPVGYRYKNELDEHYVGFIAEDVPELVATRDRKALAPMDITAVLTKVVQDQDKLLVDQNRQLAEERQRNDKQERMIETLMQRLADLEQRDRAAASAK